MGWLEAWGVEEGWKKVWKWTLSVPGDGGGQVMVDAMVVEARSWPGGMSCGHPVCLSVNTALTD